MALKIVTDSSSDLPLELAKELGITIVPLYVRFGEEVFRERVEIGDEEFYRRLVSGPVHPVTIQPSPQDFAEAYKKVAAEADGIVSLHISSKLSGTYNSALQGKEIAQVKCPIEVIDSLSVSVGLGLLSILASNAAKSGASLPQVVKDAKQAIPDVHLLGLVDTLKYLLLGGRIGRAKALVGSILNVKPLLTLENGETVPVGQARTRAKGIERLFNFVAGATSVQDVAVAYSTTLDEAKALAERIGSAAKVAVRVVRLGTTLGVHLGPGSLVLSFIGK
jgi:DegV family protein with EDD domain